MAINIDDKLVKRAINFLEEEQTQLEGAYDRQAVPGVSPGMESEFIPKNTQFSERTEKRITQNSEGLYSSEDVVVKQKFYDESIVEEQEQKFKQEAEDLQEIARAFDNEIIRLNGLINAKKQIIVDLSEEAIGRNCFPGLGRTNSTASFRYNGARFANINQDIEKTKIYTKMAGPGFNPGAENPFDPDTTVTLNSSYSGFGYENFQNNPIAFTKDSSGELVRVGFGSTTAGFTIFYSTIDGGGPEIGKGRLDISTDENDHSTTFADGSLGVWTYQGVGFQSATSGQDNYDQYGVSDPDVVGNDTPAQSATRCVGIANSINTLYSEIIDLRRERDSYRKNLNVLKKNKVEKELSHWGYQNTKNEVNVRKTKNKSLIAAIKQLDDSDDDGVQEAGLVLHFDASDNSSYFGSGTIWYDVSNDDYDDNGTINGLLGVSTSKFVEDPLDSQKNYFRFGGGSGSNNSGGEYVDFDITDSFFGDPDTVTVEMLAQITIGSTLTSFNQVDGGMMFGWNTYDVWVKSETDNPEFPALGFNIGGSVLVGLTAQRVNDLGLYNDRLVEERVEDVFPSQWAHYTFVMHKYNSTSGVSVKDQLLNNKIYINGVSESIEEVRSGATYTSEKMIFGQAGISTGIGRIGGWRKDDPTSEYNLPMEVALFRVYNKELTQEEITANFEEVRGRFDL